MKALRAEGKKINRRGPLSGRMQFIGIRLPGELVERAKAVAEFEELGFSALLRECIRDRVNRTISSGMFSRINELIEKN